MRVRPLLRGPPSPQPADQAEHHCRRDCLQKPKIAIKLMRMAKPDQGVIDYRLTGKLAGQDIDIAATATFDFSLTTGAVLRHEETASYDKCAC